MGHKYCYVNNQHRTDQLTYLESASHSAIMSRPANSLQTSITQRCSLHSTACYAASSNHTTVYLTQMQLLRKHFILNASLCNTTEMPTVFSTKSAMTENWYISAEKLKTWHNFKFLTMQENMTTGVDNTISKSSSMVSIHCCIWLLHFSSQQQLMDPLTIPSSPVRTAGL